MRFKLSLLAVAVALLACEGRSSSIVPPVDPPEEKPTLGEPARLTAAASLSAPSVSVGEEVFLRVMVRNVGGTVATDVSPAAPLQTGNGLAVLKAAPDVVELAAGESHLFEFRYEATDPGAVSFSTRVTAMDRPHDVTIEAEPAVASLVVEGAALLAVTALEVPANSLVGVPFTVTMKVANGGQSTASHVAPLPLMASGSALVERLSGPTPASASLLPGTEATFEFSYQAKTAGTVVLAGGARGTGVGDIELTAEAMSSRPMDVDVPAALNATLSIPANLSTGQSFIATLLVTNTGTSPARDVLPQPLAPVATTVSGSASATTTTTPTARDIPGGGTVAFTWTFEAAGTGSFTLATAAQGTDPLTSMTVRSPQAKSSAATVAAPSALSIVSISAPAGVTRGQVFDVVVTVKNNGGTAANDVRVNPAPPTLVKTGGANAATASASATRDLAPGASGTYTFSYTENGTAAGSLVFRCGATGVEAGSGTAVTANSTDSNLVVVSAPASLVVESVTLTPGKVSRGQPFSAEVSVRNAGGATASNVRVAPTVNASGGAAATTASNPPAVTVAGGARARFTFAYTESGTGAGSLRISAVASGTDASTSAALTSPIVSSAVLTVETPAALEVGTFVLPGTVTRGATFALSMTVTNTGQAAATGVLPNPLRPTAAVTGGVVVTSASSPTAVTIPGMSSQSFTWSYSETGTAEGTVSFTGGARGQDGNSGATVNAAAKTTNVATVGAGGSCGGASYRGFGGAVLEENRVDLTAGTDRHRVKPYAMLVGEINRVLGLTPGAINGQAATFNQPPLRWDWEQEMTAVSLFQLYSAAFQGCLQKTNTTAYNANPTAATADTHCDAWQRTFWTRVPTAAEKTACVNFAVSAANADPIPRRRWAYVCAAVLSSAGFLAE